MSDAKASEWNAPTLQKQIGQFYRDYYSGEIAQLAQQYPREKKSLEIEYSDLFRFDPDIADDLLDQPEQIIQYFEEALRKYDLPVDTSLSDANVRVGNLPNTMYPGEVSPSYDRGSYVSIRGEITKSNSNYSIIKVAAYECKRCGTLMNIPQPSHGDQQEPYECQGCERQGPFEINHTRSKHVDGQKVRVKTPPEVARGSADSIDAVLEDDLAGGIEAGDRATVTGVLQVRSQGGKNSNSVKFDPYMSAYHVDVRETDADEVDIDDEMRQRIRSLAGGEEGDPLELAAESYAPKIWGYNEVKKALVLALVGGSRVEYQGGDFDRGEFHVLLIGDPSTGKSKLITRAEDVGWRAVGVSGTGATKAGVTASAVQDDFGDGAATLEAGALVKANKGVCAIDELDDMPGEVRSALLEPMSKQVINISKWGINSKLETRTAVIAAANPKDDRFDPYQPLGDQFDFPSALMTRFDLVYTFKDRPDEAVDEEMSGHVLDMRDAYKRMERNDPLPSDVDDPLPPVAPETLRHWVALAKRQPKPVFGEGVKEKIQEQYVEFRGMYGYTDDDDSPVPINFRSLEGIVRVAEAAAKFELSETITDRHARIATELVGESMRDVGQDPETGEYDADLKETGKTQTQRNRKQIVLNAVSQLQGETDDGMADKDEVIELAAKRADVDETQIEHDVETFLHGKNGLMEPQTSKLRRL